MRGVVATPQILVIILKKLCNTVVCLRIEYILDHACEAIYIMGTIVSITTAKWGIPPVPLNHSNILL